MPLILTLGHIPGGHMPGDAAAPVRGPETRTLGEGSLTIGRAPGNGWVLADPRRHLSRTQCVIAYVEGRYVLTDLSTNGVFLNGSAEPLGADRRPTLADGDEIRFGDYVITVSGNGAPADATRPADTLDDLLATRSGPAFSHPAAATPAVREDDPFDRLDEELARDVQGRAASVEDLFKGFEPLEVWQGPSQPDNADAPVHAVTEPKFVAGSRFDDLDIDALLGDVPPGAPSGPAAQPPTPASLAAPLPAPRLPPAAPFSAPPISAAFSGAMGPDAGLAAFLEGAGVPDLHLDPGSDPQAALRAAGEVFRAMVEGLREVLMSRAAVKHEFRAEQTMLGPSDNNPLKFSVTAEDAVAALLQPGRRGYQQPLEAARESFADLKSHELAVMAGAQTALTALLRRLDPTVLEGRAGPGHSLLPAARKARCWELFRTTYRDIAREAEDDFQSVFGRDFARAYEAQVRQL